MPSAGYHISSPPWHEIGTHDAQLGKIMRMQRQPRWYKEGLVLKSCVQQDWCLRMRLDASMVSEGFHAPVQKALDIVPRIHES